MLPDATLTVRDGSLGIVPQGGNGTLALVGVSSLGTPNTVLQFSDQQTLKDTLGSGPLVEAAAHVLAVAGGPVVCVPGTPSAGSNGSVVRTGTGTSVMSFTGTPTDSYQVRVKIIQGAAHPQNGLGTFKLSLDAGRTYGPETAMPTSGSYAIAGTGLTLVFSGTSGSPLTLVAGDIYSADETGPSLTVSNLNAAVSALLADSTPWFMLWAVGVPADPSTAAAVFAALDTKLSTAEAGYRYVAGLMNGPDDTDANIDTAMGALASTRMQVAIGFEALTSPISGSQYKREAAFVEASRAASVPPHEDPGKVATGSVKGGVTQLFRDEFRTPGMDAKRYVTLRTHLGLPGFFITSGRMFSSPQSDFQYLPLRRVMDIAATTVRTAQLAYLNSTVRVNASTGFILEADARAIESRIAAQLRAAITQPGYASDVDVQVSRTENMLSTQTLRIKYLITPLGYARQVAGEIGFLNPALQKVALAA